MNPPQNETHKRKRWLLTLGLVFLLAGLIYGLQWFLHGRTHISTDDAYVTGTLIRITPRVAGTVVEVLVDDTDAVQQGQELVRLDATDAQLALEKAEADLAEVVRRISRSFADRSQQQARLNLQQHVYAQAQADLDRRQGAVALQAVSQEEAEHARSARDQAQAALKLAQAQLAAAEAEVGGTTVAGHPAVKQAEARLRAAWLDRARCVIRAPEAGQVAQRAIQVGQQIAPGHALMTLVPMTHLWVEANFKEDQLKGMQDGQPVRLTSDLYGRGTVFHGRVEGLSPGTGSVFSLLPPQNASGNWIKIVQRLPVRIALDPGELDKHPLRVGLSMRVEVDIGARPEPLVSEPRRYTTQVFADELQGVEERIRQIVKANLGFRP